METLTGAYLPTLTRISNIAAVQQTAIIISTQLNWICVRVSSMESFPIGSCDTLLIPSFFLLIIVPLLFDW